MTRMKKRVISTDAATERRIAVLVKGKYPSASEMIRDLIRREAERRAIA